MNSRGRPKQRTHQWRLAAMMAVCTVVYYSPSLLGLAGWTTVQASANALHDFYGMDFYSLVFFAPAVYAAYTMGVIEAVLVALAVMLILLPHNLFIDNRTGAFFRPAAFAIILSAVSAVVAMLQKDDEQKRRNMGEIECLYAVGRAAESGESTDDFLNPVAGAISRALGDAGDVGVQIIIRDKQFTSDGFPVSGRIIENALMNGGEPVGKIRVSFSNESRYFAQQDRFHKTLADRVSSAVREIEMQQSLSGYYGQLEEMVEARTRDLEQAQERLVRNERLAAVGELASGVGHELRNPLNVIRNCVFLLNMCLAEQPTNEEIANTLKVLDQQVDISNRIVSDLLDFTRVRPPTPTALDLNDLVRQSLLGITVPQEITVKCDWDMSLPQALIDPEQVGRGFANIITNALQAISGKGELVIKTAHSRHHAWVSFTDNGCGIAPDNLKKIFEPLFTTKPKGIGLGLAITKRLVDQNGGDIQVESEVGKGTTFTIKFPLSATGPAA